MGTGLKLKRLNSKDSSCWGDVPEIRRSITEAAVHFGQRGVERIIDRVIATFVTEGHPEIPASQQNTTALWYVVDEAGAVVAHLLAIEDAWDTAKCIYVNQLWARGLPVELQRMAAEELDHYARSRECQHIYMYTRRDTPRFWRARFGFERYRILYRRTLT